MRMTRKMAGSSVFFFSSRRRHTRCGRDWSSDVCSSDLEVGFSRLGVRWELEGSNLRVPRDQELVVQDDLGAAIPKVDDGPWPAFPADLTSIALAIATQARGTVMIFEKMYENRLFFVDKLVGMGARIILCDPHRAVVS